jgi:hypothetical protein
VLFEYSYLFSAHLVPSEISESLDHLIIYLLFFDLFGKPSRNVIFDKLKVILLALSPPLAEFLFINLYVLRIGLFLFLCLRRSMFVRRFFIITEELNALFFNNFPCFELTEQGFDCYLIRWLLFQDFFVNFVSGMLQLGEFFSQAVYHFLRVLKMEEVLEVFVRLVTKIKFQRDSCIYLQNIFKSIQIFFRLKVYDQSLSLFNKFLRGNSQQYL